MPPALPAVWRASDHAGWIAALVVAGVLQLIVAWRSPLVARDGLDFIQYARGLRQSGCELIRVQDQHPGYPLMVWGSTVLVRPWGLPDTRMWIQAARIPSMLGGLACVLLVWLLARRLFDRPTADIAALVFAAMPIFRQSAADALSDSPHLFFYLLATWLVCEGLARMSWRWFAAAGAASGAAYWVRPEGLGVALVAAATLVVLLFSRPGRRWQALLGCGAALVATTVAVAIPYPLIAGKVTSKQNPYAQQQPRKPFLVNEAAAQAAAPAAVGPGPTAKVPSAASAGMTFSFLLKTLGRAFYEFGDEIIRGFRFFFLVFYVLGYFELRKRPWDGRLLGFLYALATLHIVVLFGVFFMSGYISHRHVMPLVALAMPWIALGIMYAAETIRRVARVPVSRRQGALLCAAVSCAIVVPRAVRELHVVFLPTLQASAWICQHTRPTDRMLTNSRYVSYFSQRPTIILTDRNPTVQDALARVPGDRSYQLAVLDLAEDGFQPAWLSELSRTSTPLFRLEAVVDGRVEPRLVVLDHAVAQVASGATAPQPGANGTAPPAAVR